MSSESDGPIYGPEIPKPKINTGRANRKLERWLFSGGDQREMSEMLSRRPLPGNLFDGGEHIMTIVYKSERDEQGNITNIETSYLNPEGEQLASDSTNLKTE